MKHFWKNFQFLNFYILTYKKIVRILGRIWILFYNIKSTLKKLYIWNLKKLVKATLIGGSDADRIRIETFFTDADTDGRMMKLADADRMEILKWLFLADADSKFASVQTSNHVYWLKSNTDKMSTNQFPTDKYEQLHSITWSKCHRL